MWRYYPFTVFGPVVEPNHPNAFLSEEPGKLLTFKRVKNIPWLIGMSKDEGLYPAAGKISSTMKFTRISLSKCYFSNIIREIRSQKKGTMGQNQSSQI